MLWLVLIILASTLVIPVGIIGAAIWFHSAVIAVVGGVAMIGGVCLFARWNRQLGSDI